MNASVTVGRDGLEIDGRPFYLLAGCVHYFRWPRAEWRGLLEQARDFGLNTIDTVIPWNRHEPQPGAFDFAEEADLGAFLDLCQELGLKAIVRPGPYICAEWENGGLPAWLTAEPGLLLRTDDERYMGAIRRWFDALMPIIAPRQHDRGGPVILCQIENEHWASTVYAHDEHQLSLDRAAAERGITVPQYTCMGAMPGRPEFRNGWSGIAEKLVQTRALWPENPMIVSELWSGWFDNWGSSRQTRKSPAKLDVTLHQLAAVGASGFSHWMWAGGTNFGYWGGRTVGGDTIHMTTSYDYDAPISEFGAPREKAYVARRHHLFLGSLGAPLARVLADAVPGGLKVIAPAAVRGRSEGGAQPYRTVRAGPGAPAGWERFCCTYLQNPGLEGASYQIFLPDGGPHLTVEVEPTSVRPIFCELPLGGGLRLAHHTGRILGYWPGDDGHDLLAIYGPEGEQGALHLRLDGDTPWLGAPGSRWHDELPPGVSLRGYKHAALHNELRYWLTADPAVVTLHFGERRLHVALLSTEQADRFVPADPRWRAASPVEAAPPAPAAAPRRLRLPLERLGVREAEDGDGWTAIDGPQPLERLGTPYGYGWYRAEVELAGPEYEHGPDDDPHPTALALPGLSDRALLRAGAASGWHTLGVGPDGPAYTFSHVLSAGRLELLVLADNLGRFNYGSNLGEPKGLLDGIYAGARQEDISRGWSALWQEVAFAGEAVADAKPWAVRADAADVDLGRFAFEGPSVWLLRELYCEPGRRHLLHLTGDRNSGGLFVNGVAVQRFSRHRSGGVIKADITEHLRPGARNVIALTIQGYAGAPWRATLLRYDPAARLPARWSFRPGVTPGAAAPPAGGPAFYRAAFPREQIPAAAAALRLRVGGLGKGQIWLNGQNIGRFWQIGPQEDYKLPVSWLRPQNELLIFAESGAADAVTLLAE